MWQLFLSYLVKLEELTLNEVNDSSWSPYHDVNATIKIPNLIIDAGATIETPHLDRSENHQKGIIRERLTSYNIMTSSLTFRLGQAVSNSFAT